MGTFDLSQTHWQPVKLMVAAVDVAPAVTVSDPFAEFVFTEAGDDIPQSAVPPDPGAKACAATV